jgi:hypothetical protein
MFGLAVMGALIAGAYGILHDQISYTISPEYFTKLKFEQFHYANFWPRGGWVSSPLGFWRAFLFPRGQSRRPFNILSLDLALFSGVQWPQELLEA